MDFFSMIAAISQNDLSKVVSPVIQVCNVLVPVLLSVVGAVGAIWCIYLGVKYARAEDQQEHDKMKKSLKNSIIGFVLIFVLLIMLQIGLVVFTDWWANYNV